MPTLSATLFPLNTTSYAVTMAVNGLATGLIVFKILKMFLEVNAATGARDTTKYRHIVFIIIESGMTLFVIQLVRLVLWVVEPNQLLMPLSPALYYILLIGEMFNVIIRSVHFYFFCFTEKNYMARASHQQ